MNKSKGANKAKIKRGKGQIVKMAKQTSKRAEWVGWLVTTTQREWDRVQNSHAKETWKKRQKRQNKKDGKYSLLTNTFPAPRTVLHCSVLRSALHLANLLILIIG